MKKYEFAKDEELVTLANAGDDEAQEYLFEKYKALVKAKTYPYFIVGADRDDIIQEGMIGLYKAVRDFKGEKNISFYRFAEVCITRQILTAVKLSLRQKHVPLNTSVSLSSSTGEDETGIIDSLPDVKVQSPEEVFIDRENVNFIETEIEDALSIMELRVLRLHLQGKTYAEIAAIVNKDEKSVNNSLQRVRRKLDKLL